MRLFNSDGAALFGPGSEWLWTMVTGVVLALTGVAIFRQLSAQRFGTELGYWRSLNDEWMSDRMKRFRLAALIEVARGRPDLSYAMQEVGAIFEELAYLQNHSLFESDMNLDLGRVNVQRWWWGMAAPRIGKARENDPGMWREWERMAMRMRDRDRRAGVELNLSEEVLNGRVLHEAIAAQMDGLRVEQEMRSGALPAWPDEPALGAEE